MVRLSIPTEKMIEMYSGSDAAENLELDMMGICDMPSNTLAYFERRAKMYILPELYKKGNFEMLFRASLGPDDEVITHGSLQKKTINTGEGGSETYKLVDLFDTNEDNERLGRPEIVFNISSTDTYFLNKPFVGWNGTEEGCRRQGLGMRRLLLMNVLSLHLFDYPLNSDTNQQGGAKEMWEKLVSREVAEKYMQGRWERYVMKHD